jgi:hypothetical protein
VFCCKTIDGQRAVLSTAELDAGKGTDAATDQVDEHCGRLFHDGRRDPLGFLCVQPFGA